MNKTQYFELQKSAQLTNQASADLFEVNISTIKRWRNGKLKAPRAVIMVLESMVKSAKPIESDQTGDSKNQLDMLGE